MTPLAVTANNATQTYNGQPYSGGNGVTFSSPPNSNLLGTVSYSGTSQGAINAGDYVITPGGLYSNQQGYIISYASGTLTVTTAALNVTADAQSRAYGAANPPLTYTSTGLVNGDTLTGLLATTATTTSNIGTYAITQGTLAASSNYALTYTPANLTVTAAALTVTADAQSRAYGAANPTAHLYEHRPGQRRHVDRTARHHGDRDLQRRRPTRSPKARWRLRANYALTYIGANLTVTAAALTVTADPQTRAYGAANPTLTYTTHRPGQRRHAHGLLATAATPTSNVGAYAITQGTLAASSNYTLTYTAANLTVTAAALTVTADAQTRAYGAANPTLTYVRAPAWSTATRSPALLATTATATSNVGATRSRKARSPPLRITR